MGATAQGVCLQGDIGRLRVVQFVLRVFSPPMERHDHDTTRVRRTGSGPVRPSPLKLAPEQPIQFLRTGAKVGGGDIALVIEAEIEVEGLEQALEAHRAAPCQGSLAHIR